jgi:hypothetical protein
MVSEDSVHGLLALLFLGHGEREHHGGRTGRSKVAPLMVARKWREAEEGAGTKHNPKNYFFQVAPPRSLHHLSTTPSNNDSIAYSCTDEGTALQVQSFPSLGPNL